MNNESRNSLSFIRTEKMETFTIDDRLRIRVYYPPTMVATTPLNLSAARVILFCVHGGCFSSGDETYNEEQSVAFAKRDTVVVHVGFTTTNGPKMAVLDLLFAYYWLRRRGASSGNLNLVGISSGAFFAALLMEKVPFDSYSFIAPVFDPMERHVHFTNAPTLESQAICDMQLRHFQTIERMQAYTDKVMRILGAFELTMFIYYATEDRNVPDWLAEKQCAMLDQQIAITEVFESVGHEITYSTQFADFYELATDICRDGDE